jgi:hypothetical protein
MQRLVLIAVLVDSTACSLGARPALTSDGSPPDDSAGANRTRTNDAASDWGNDAAAGDGAPDADVCGTYTGGLGHISESRLPAGACAAATSCVLYTWDPCPNDPRSGGPQKQWSCECKAGSWSCALIGIGKLDCGPPVGSVDGSTIDAIDASRTSPDAPFCCPRDTAMAGCLYIGGVNNSGCYLHCDFWCSTNWRVEIDMWGCERWAYDYRPPAPGENMQCLPETDADRAVPGG